MIHCINRKNYPPVAQLDSAADSDSEGRGFESLRADQKRQTCFSGLFVSFLSHEQSNIMYFGAILIENRSVFMFKSRQ